MSSGARLVLVVVLGMLLLIGCSVGLAAAAVYYDGTVRVEFAETGPGGSRFHVVVPASLVDVAVAAVPDDAFSDVMDEARPWVSVAGGAGRELAGCPDTVFVEVSTRNEHLVVEKRRGKFIVRFDGPGERFEISFPVKTLDRVLTRLENAA